MFKNIKKVHFVGIGGIGMSGIAEILLNQGFEITGSDKSYSEVTNRLQELGIKVYEGHSPENLKDADVLVYSSAVSLDNPEVKEALESGVEIIMLDNMDTEEMEKAVKVINKRAVVEASGGINLDNIVDVAKTGVDLISVGALTHSARACDISMNIVGT